MFGNFTLLFTLTLLSICEGFYFGSDIDPDNPMMVYNNNLKEQRRLPCTDWCSKPENEKKEGCENCGAGKIYLPENENPISSFNTEIIKRHKGYRSNPNIIWDKMEKPETGIDCKYLYYEALKYCGNEIFAV